MHTQLATGIALHGLSLAVTGKVVGSATLVASSRASAASEAAPEATIAATGSASTTAHSWVGAVAGKMASNTAAVAASARTSSAQPQCWAVSLHVSEALAVVALLSCCLVSVLVLAQFQIAGPLQICKDGNRGTVWSGQRSSWVQNDILSVVRGCGHPLDSCPGCLPACALEDGCM